MKDFCSNVKMRRTDGGVTNGEVKNSPPDQLYNLKVRQVRLVGYVQRMKSTRALSELEKDLLREGKPIFRSLDNLVRNWSALQV